MSALIQNRTSIQLRCPACNDLTNHRYLFSKNECDILQCASCGIARADASFFDPNSYYTADYFSGGRPDGYADYRGAEPVLRREFRRVVRFIRKHRDSGRLLEIGCAYGFLLQEAAPYYDLAGIEFVSDAATFCRERGLRVLNGVANENTLAQFGPMDVIVLFDVIEHLPNPRETLELCSRYLNPNGIIVITTGDFASLYARLSGLHWRLMTPPQHLWYFTPESMRRLSHSLHLSLEVCDHPYKLVPLALIQFQLRRLLGLNQPSSVKDHSQIGIPINLFDAMRCVLRNNN